jgi:hypothetical protein
VASAADVPVLLAEVARLTLERDEARADAKTVMDDLQRIVPEIDAQLVRARAVVDAAREWRDCRIAEAARWSSYEARTAHPEQQWLPLLDAWRAAHEKTKAARIACWNAIEAYDSGGEPAKGVVE